MIVGFLMRRPVALALAMLLASECSWGEATANTYADENGFLSTPRTGLPPLEATEKEAQGL